MHNEIGGWLWLFIDVGLVAVLAAAMLYGSMQWRNWQHHPAQKRARDRATRAQFDAKSRTK